MSWRTEKPADFVKIAERMPRVVELLDYRDTLSAMSLEIQRDMALARTNGQVAAIVWRLNDLRVLMDMLDKDMAEALFEAGGHSALQHFIAGKSART
jgi:hypothetical protein